MRCLKKILILSLRLLVLHGPVMMISPGIAQQLEYASPAGTKFLLYTPPGYYTTTNQYPLLLSLHSKGEVSEDISELTSKNPEQMPCKLIYLNKWPKEYPFIVLTPQLRPTIENPDPQWSAEYIDEVVRYVMANFRVDVSRVYLTGISRGGTGAWTYASAYPSKIAAMIPISGRSDLTQACPIKDIPIWAFHGDGDVTATPQFSIDMVNTISNCQPSGRYKPHLTILSAKGHNGWNEVYNGTNGYRIYEWLLQFRKNNFANRPPYVSAGQDLKVALRGKPITLVGYFFDADGTLSNVKWEQTSGIPLTLNGKTRYLQLANPVAGIFEFELTVTDNDGAISRDRVRLEVVNTPMAPYVSSLVLVNGKTNIDFGTLSEGQVIDLNASGLPEVNVRATVSADTRSVRFSINSDENTRTLNTTSPLYIKPQSTSAEWQPRPGDYGICATPYSGTSGTGVRGTSQCVMITIATGVTNGAAGKIMRELWNNITGKEVRLIPVTTTPSSVTELMTFEGGRNIGDNYGARIRGYIHPPVTGNYVFFIASDDHSELWLSSDESPANKTKIAYVTGSTSYRQWNKYTSQRSVAKALQAGKRYYIEALHKEGTTYDHVSVGWQLPNGISELPIPGGRLSPWENTSVSERIPTESHEENREWEMNVYPNPISSQGMIIDIGHQKSGDIVTGLLTLHAISGTKILEQEVIIKNGRTQVDLSAGNEAGIYFVTLRIDNSIIRRKIYITDQR